MRYWPMIFIGSMLFIPSGVFADETEWLNGFRGAKWGMSPVKVKKALKLKIAKTTEERSPGISYKDSDYVGFNFGGPLILECWFYHGKLYRVKRPFNAGEQKTLEVRMDLEDKHGRPTIIGFKNPQTQGCESGGNASDTECVVWNVGLSRITLWGGMKGLSKEYAENVDYEHVIFSQKAKSEEDLKKKKVLRKYKRKVKQIR